MRACQMDILMARINMVVQNLKILWFWFDGGGGDGTVGQALSLDRARARCVRGQRYQRRTETGRKQFKIGVLA
jgi:hypothetical protein